MIFVHEGSGTIESIFGDVPYKPGDYVVVPRGTTYRFEPADGEQRYLVFESPGLIEIPQRYRNEYGQLLEHAPYYHRDIHPPDRAATRIASAASSTSRCACAAATRRTSLDYHPFDVVGWDGYVYPWTFSIHDFEPITGRIHMPPPSHQTFQGRELRDLLVLSAQARLRPAGDPDPVSPLEPGQSEEMIYYVDGQVRVAQGRSRSGR